eukprot:g424.t1
MSTNALSNKDAKKPKSTSTFSWVSDKLAAGAARVNGGEFQDIEVAVVKATNHDVVPPKEKHVRTLREVISTAQNRKKVVYIIHALYERLVLPNETWLIILKTLMVFHKLMKSDGEGTFKQEMVKYKEKRKLTTLLSLGNFTDQTSKEKWDYSAFVRVYSQYLEEKLLVFEQIAFDIERDSGDGIRFKSATSNELLTELPRIQKLLQRVLACVPEGSAAQSEVVMECMKWTITECFRLFRIISEGVISLAENFFDMDRIDARKGLEMYREAVHSTSQMQSFFSAMQGLSVGQQIQFPQLQSPPEDFIEQMEEYVKGATGRTATRKFPSTISRNARGGPSAAIASGGGGGGGGGTQTKVELTKMEEKIPEEKIEEQTDLLSLDVLDLADPAPSTNIPPVVENNTVLDPFADPAFGAQNPVNTNDIFGQQNAIPTNDVFVAQNTVNTGPVFAAQNAVNTGPVFGVQNTVNTDPVFGGQTAIATNDVFRQQNAVNTGSVFGQQNLVTPDNIFGGQTAVSGDSGFMEGWQQPPRPAVSPVPETGGGVVQDQGGSPFDDFFGGGIMAQPPPPPVALVQSSGMNYQQHHQTSTNPFGDTGLAPSPPPVSPGVNLGQNYLATGSQFTGPGAFVDPFDGLNPAAQRKSTGPPPGVPMRTENQNSVDPFANNAPQNQQQNFTNFF